MEKRNHELAIHVDSNLVLCAGWWEEYTASDGSKSRVISPHEHTLFEQVLRYLETVAAQSHRSREAPISLSEQVRAILAVCLRWGSYFAVLTDFAKPVWPTASQRSVSLIADAEMARINIEASAALEQWIDIMRSDYEHYCALVRAAKHLPLPLKQVRAVPRDGERFLEWAFFSECLRSLCSPQDRSQLIASRGEEEWVQQRRKQVIAYPTRMLANGIINMCWRNGSSIENLHAGTHTVPVPLLQRRLTRRQEQTLMRETGEMLMAALEVVHDLISEQSEDSWAMRVLPFALFSRRFSVPRNWSLSEKTREVKLDGAEPS